jgi:DNA-binding response OmpR family regulator
MEPSRVTTSGGPRVLVVDDYQDGADSLALMLRAFGADARTAYDGESALLCAAEFQPALVLLDLTLPGVSGFDVARSLRATGPAPLRLIAVSGWSDDNTRTETLAAGFDEYVVKPIAIEKVQALLAEARRAETTDTGTSLS